MRNLNKGNPIQLVWGFCDLSKKKKKRKKFSLALLVSYECLFLWLEVIFVFSFEVICKKENLKSSYMLAWDVGHLYPPVWPKNLLPMNSSYKEDVQKKHMVVIIKV